MRWCLTASGALQLRWDRLWADRVCTEERLGRPMGTGFI